MDNQAAQACEETTQQEFHLLMAHMLKNTNSIIATADNSRKRKLEDLEESSKVFTNVDAEKEWWKSMQGLKKISKSSQMLDVKEE